MPYCAAPRLDGEAQRRHAGSHAALSLPGLNVPPGLGQAILHQYQAPLIALAVVLLLGLLGRIPRARWLLPVAGAAGALAGWAALLPAAAVLRAVMAPRALIEVLLLPGVAAVVAILGAAWFRTASGGRAERWVAVGLAALTGWWLAGSAPGRAEFWRVWLAIAAAAWLLARVTEKGGSAGGRVSTAALALAAGLLVAGAPPIWIAAALVAVAAGLSAWAVGGALPPLLVVTVAAAADLGFGRLVRGGLTAIDLACLLPVVAAWVTPWAAGRMPVRLGRAGPPAAMLASAAAAAGVVWLGGRLLQM